MRDIHQFPNFLASLTNHFSTIPSLPTPEYRQHHQPSYYRLTLLARLPFSFTIKFIQTLYFPKKTKQTQMCLKGKLPILLQYHRIRSGRAWSRGYLCNPKSINTCWVSYSRQLGQGKLGKGWCLFSSESRHKAALLFKSWLLNSHACSCRHSTSFWWQDLNIYVHCWPDSAHSEVIIVSLNGSKVMLTLNVSWKAHVLLYLQAVFQDQG